MVTGAAGFIGSHLCERLLQSEYEVTGIDNFDPFYDADVKRENLESALRHPRFRFVEGDIRDAELIQSMARDILDGTSGSGTGDSRRAFDAIIHLAARAGVRPSLDDPVLYTDVNLVGTTHLLEVAREFKVPKFIFASSSSVYGEREGAPFKETDIVDFPVSPYAATKKAGEVLCHAHHHLYGFAVTCLRFFTVYGPRQRPEMAIHKFTRAIDRGDTVSVFGDGHARRDFTYIDDVVDGILRALERAGGYRIYNLGNGRTVELQELIILIEKASGKTAKLERWSDQPGDVPFTCADISRARTDLGYSPSTPIEKGIQLFVDWFRRNRSIG